MLTGGLLEYIIAKKERREDMSDTNQELLLKIYQEVIETKEKVKDVPKIQEEILVMKRQIVEMQQEIKEIKQEERNISGSVARIEVEHGEKLVALFDAFKVNTENIEKQDRRITKCENIVEKHDHELYILNSKIQNKEIQNA